MNSANATNGFLAYCQGANNCGMGGAGVALPQDSVSAAINPALISRVDSQFFISPGWFHPVRDLNQTDGVPNPNAQVNTLLNEDSQRENFMDFSGGINYAVTPTITLGVAAYGSGGMSTKYSAARVGTGGGVSAPNPGDSQVLYRLLHIVPTVAWQPTEKSAIGLSLVVGYSDLETDHAKNDAAGTAGALNNGGDMKRDHAWGGGVRLGGVVDLDDRVTLGATYASPVWFQRFRHYRELLLGPLNTPQNFTVGAVVHASPDTDLAFDVKYVGWSSVEALRVNPAAGGFGWNSKPIFMLGVQHRWNKDITLRAGYNYGESPIPTENTFANALFPAVTEHHLSIGGSYKVSPAWTVTGSGFYSPTATQTDDGTGDGKSGAGKGVTVSMYQMGVQIGIARKF